MAEFLSASVSYMAGEGRLYTDGPEAFLKVQERRAAEALEDIGGIKPFAYTVTEEPFGQRIMTATEAHASVLRTGAQRAIVKAKARTRNREG